MTNLVQMAADKRPEDFKNAVVAELNSRLQTVINDKREDMASEVFGEELINKHDKSYKMKPGSMPQASDPKATNPGAMGHEQENKKKSGSKMATHPSMEEENDMEDDDMYDKDKSKYSDEDKNMYGKDKSKYKKDGDK